MVLRETFVRKSRFSVVPIAFFSVSLLYLNHVLFRAKLFGPSPPPISLSSTSELLSWSPQLLNNHNVRERTIIVTPKANDSTVVVVTTTVTTTTTTVGGVTTVTTATETTTVQHPQHQRSNHSSLLLTQPDTSHDQHQHQTAVSKDVAPSDAKEDSNRDVVASPKANFSSTPVKDESKLTQVQQVLTATLQNLQHLSRRNASRALCGNIRKSSPEAERFPRILSSSSSLLPKDNKHNKGQKQPLPQPNCRPNAIVYLAQKGKHGSYGRNSSALFTASLDSLYKNYLSINQQYNNVDVLIIHSGDFDQDDLDAMDRKYEHKVHFKLVNLNDTDYWVMPESVQHDNRHLWQQAGKYNLGYRHMLRWYSLKLYDFARDYGKRNNGCSYSYLMRMDEDSFLHSRIEYDLFDFMQSHNYAYAYRMCSYEMEMQLWYDYEDHVQYCGDKHYKMPPGIPRRRMEPGLCGFYNNFFIVQVQFILQPDVQHFLQWTDAIGIMYRERYNDLQIQTFAVYAFAPPERIHRFLDWTYEHMSDFKGCPRWGALQAGYLDPYVNVSMNRFFEKYKPCNANLPRNTYRDMFEYDLSPTYAHLPNSSWFLQTFGVPRQQFAWKTFAAATVESMGRGNFSG